MIQFSKLIFFIQSWERRGGIDYVARAIINDQQLPMPKKKEFLLQAEEITRDSFIGKINSSVNLKLDEGATEQLKG